MGGGSFAHREPWNIPRIVRFDKNEIISNFVM